MGRSERVRGFVAGAERLIVTLCCEKKPTMNTPPPSPTLKSLESHPLEIYEVGMWVFKGTNYSEQDKMVKNFFKYAHRNF